MLRCRGPGITTLRELSHSAQAHCSHTGLGGTVSPIQALGQQKPTGSVTVRLQMNTGRSCKTWYPVSMTFGSVFLVPS